MGKINILDKSVYNRIAAGEVVERPFSVVKELVENAIDSGADNISITITDGGKQLIRVSDNGCGIEKDDLPKAFMPHATSKIENVEDLDTIATLGFRGEALASIASVAKVTITSEIEGASFGYTITAENGVVGEPEMYPFDKGTTVEVFDLFKNIPARAKFLKPSKNEETDITNIVSRLILAHPEISFKYTADDKMILQSYGGGLSEAIIQIYGYEAASDCMIIDTVKNGIKISGYIGNYYFVKPNRTYQTVILNGRYIINNTIQSAIHNAYSGYLMKRKYPFYILNIEMPKEFVDVNVHPNKTDVRFMDNQVIYGIIYSVISKALDGSAGAENIVKSNPYFQLDPGSRPIVKQPKPDVADMKLVKCDRPYEPQLFSPTSPHFAFRHAKEPVEFVGGDPEEKAALDDIFAENKKYIEQLEKEQKEREAKQETFDVDENFRIVGQVLTTYLILEKGQEIFFIDQHAAHERLIFDKLMEDFKKGKVAEQSLLVPVVIRTNEKETEFLLGKLDYLHGMGMDIVEYDVNQFNVYSVPLVLTDLDVNAFIEDILSDMTLRQSDVPDIIREKLAQKACKSAIKSGKVLSDGEKGALLMQLKDNMGLRCPHGRPVAVKITRTEIDKWFKRIV